MVAPLHDSVVPVVADRLQAQADEGAVVTPSAATRAETGTPSQAPESGSGFAVPEGRRAGNAGASSAATKRPWFERVDPRLVVLYLIGFIGLVITFIVGWLA